MRSTYALDAGAAIKSWASSDFIVARELLSPEMQCIIKPLFHYVCYVVVELSVYGIPFTNIAADTFCGKSTGLNLICQV
jgi:hypothetical protein